MGIVHSGFPIPPHPLTVRRFVSVFRKILTVLSQKNFEILHNVGCSPSPGECFAGGKVLDIPEEAAILDEGSRNTVQKESSEEGRRMEEKEGFRTLATEGPRTI